MTCLKRLPVFMPSIGKIPLHSCPVDTTGNDGNTLLNGVLIGRFSFIPFLVTTVQGSSSILTQVSSKLVFGSPVLACLLWEAGCDPDIPLPMCEPCCAYKWSCSLLGPVMCLGKMQAKRGRLNVR